MNIAPAQERRSPPWLALALLFIVPIVVVCVSLLGPFQTNASVVYGGIREGGLPPLVAGQPTIDPNFGATSHALGTKAARDVVSGRLPLWNHNEGLGAPLLGEMQSAALFPPTWLMAARHGQIIEQALLQLLGGVGAYLFFRRFGMGNKASAAGAIVFEVNGVFAWLRNAIFNPVAFLPWLFYSVETAAALARDGVPWRRRLFNICLGAALSALAVYSGFPEELYLYSMLVAIWAVFRLVGLRGGARIVFLADLLAIGTLAIALSAPLLVSFAAYIPESSVGGHAGNGFYGAHLPAGAALQHILPYVYGSVFNPDASTQVQQIWGNIGGYVGAAPLLLAAAAVCQPGHRAAKSLLLVWIAISIAVTFGVQPINHIFMMLPMTAITACFRYITISLIFAFLFLAVMQIDAVDKDAGRTPRRWVAVGVLAAVALTIYTVVLAWPMLHSGPIRPRIFARINVAVAAGVFVTISMALFIRTRHAATILAVTVIAEAIVLFAAPYLSFPRGGHVNRPLVAFLKENVGFSRVLSTPSAAIAPNYGSYFGISTINYDDLPSPARTSEYIKKNLDAYAHPIIFIPYPVGITPAQQELRQKNFPAALLAYAKAGVKYVTVGADFDDVPAYRTLPDNGLRYPLAVGGHLDISVQNSPEQPRTVAVLRVMIGPHGALPGGILSARICVKAECAQGRVAIAKVPDNQPASILLDRPIRIGSDYSIRLEKSGGNADIALRMAAVTADMRVKVAGGPVVPQPGTAPLLSMGEYAGTIVYRDQSTKVIELPDVRPYIQAGSCKLTIFSRDEVTADCPAATRVVRLELFMPGWWATISGASRHVDVVEDAFQGVDLPAGKSHVEFVYWPRFMSASLVVAVVALALLILGCWLSGRAHRRAHAVKAPCPP